MDNDEDEAALKRAMLSSCKESYFLLDRAKLDKTALMQICPACGLTRVIIDYRGPIENTYTIRCAGSHE